MSRTIEDFGNQWQRHGIIRDTYWTSDELFRTHFKNLTPPFENLKNSIVVDVGAGSGRTILMLSRYKPKKIYGIEPSSGYAILKKNTIDIPNLTLINETAELFQLEEKADFIFSLGVIHHIRNPKLAIANIHHNLNKNGMFILWVYGQENNSLYVLIQRFFRPVIRLIPDFFLDKLSFILTYCVDLYLKISIVLFSSNLPLTKYLINLFSKCDRNEKKYIIFDQLNPVYSKHYKKNELHKLLTESGFINIEYFHRFSSSWTAIAVK